MVEPDHEDNGVQGYLSNVRRQGATIVRESGDWTPAVHAFLAHLEAAAPGIAPHVLGSAAGHETLSYIPGYVPSLQEFSTVSVAAVRSTGRLLRRLHEAARSFRLPDGVRWHHARSTTGSRVVICHNDISPRNTVFHGDEAVAFIDWDFAGPDDPHWDLAHAIWQFAPLMPDAGCRLRGWTETLPDRCARADALLDGYGSIGPDDRAAVLRLVSRRVQATLTGIERMIEAGDPTARRLVADRVPEELRGNLTWLAAFLADRR